MFLVAWGLTLLPMTVSGQAAGDDATPAGASELTTGAWRGEGGPETFVFQFQQDGEGLTGLVHTLGEGMKMTELPVEDVMYDPPRLTLRFPHGPVFEGTLDPAKRAIDGAILVDGNEVGKMPLEWVDPASIPVLDPGEGRYVDEPYSYRAPGEAADGWPVADASAAGLDEATLGALVRDIHAGRAGVLHALLVASKGQLVVEEYFHGCRAETQHSVLSVTKSIGSLLVGIAVDRGEITGVDAPLAGFFPDCTGNRAAGWDKTTLRHLLTMSLGLDWNAGEMHGLHGTGPEFFCSILSRDFAFEPGRKWRYANADVDLLAGVLHQATGVQADAYAREHLFEPLGIADWNWDYMRQDGFPLVDGSLRLTARGMLSIGQMVLEDGSLRGRRVVSEDWITASTAAQIETGEPQGYGYLWWRFHLPGPTGEVTALVANGWGSQFIAVFPDLDLVVVTLGGNQDNGKHMSIGPLLGQHLLGGSGTETGR